MLTPEDKKNAEEYVNTFLPTHIILGSKRAEALSELLDIIEQKNKQMQRFYYWALKNNWVGYLEDYDMTIVYKNYTQNEGCEFKTFKDLFSLFPEQDTESKEVIPICNHSYNPAGDYNQNGDFICYKCGDKI